jgi:Zn-dependent protease
VFGDGENPLSWGVTVARVAGIRVRVHVFFAVYLVGQLIWAALPSQAGLWWAVPMAGALFALVLLHEFGHCVACRLVGGEADEIMMWPLGGLATCRPPADWRADLLTTLGGPGVNVALLPVLAGGVYAATGSWGSVVFNPAAPGVGLGAALLRDGSQPWWLVWLWSGHYANAVLLLFNMLVPMYPMDAGRVVEALAWRSGGPGGRSGATVLACTVGLFAAGVVAVGGMVTQEATLILIAGFGAYTCWHERQRLKVLGAEEAGGFEAMNAVGSRGGDERAAGTIARAEDRAAEKAAARQAELDRVLAKISESGMGSLTGAERRVLERATKDRRGGSE